MVNWRDFTLQIFFIIGSTESLSVAPTHKSNECGILSIGPLRSDMIEICMKVRNQVHVLMCERYQTCTPDRYCVHIYLYPIYSHCNNKTISWPPFTHELTFISAGISNHMPSEVWEGITFYPYPNFYRCIVEVWEWLINVILHFVMYISTYP